MNKKRILALMYDFYNSHTLKGQNDDIDYYIKQIKKYKAKEVLIIGAGTGRVAIPLSKHAAVTALDFDKSRLMLLKEKEKNIHTICINFLNYKTDKAFDLIIIPYSTLQFNNNNKNKLTLFFRSLCNIMKKNTIVIFDVSESFNSKEERKRELLFKDYSTILNEEIEVYYSSKRYKEYIEFFIEYKLCSRNITVLEHEKYYYYNKDLLSLLINDNNLKLLKIDDGYGKNDFRHKHLYHCRRIL